MPSNNRVEITGNHTSPFEAIGQSAAGISYSQFVNSSTSAVGNGVGLELRALTSTQERQLSFITSRWLDNTDASRKSRLIITTNDGGTLYNTYQAYGKDPILAADAGNVGIGIVTPTSLLHVDGTTPSVHVSAAANQNSFIRMTELTNHEGGFIHYDGSANVFSLGVHDGNNTTSASDNKVINIVRSDGNVGIGTATPVAPVHIFSDGTSNTPEIVLCLGANTS